MLYRSTASSTIGALQAAIDEAKTLAKITKPINQSEVVDYSFLRAAVKK